MNMTSNMRSSAHKFSVSKYSIKCSFVRNYICMYGRDDIILRWYYNGYVCENYNLDLLHDKYCREQWEAKVRLVNVEIKQSSNNVFRLLHKRRYSSVLAQIKSNSMLVRTARLVDVYPDLNGVLTRELFSAGATLADNPWLHRHLFGRILDLDLGVLSDAGYTTCDDSSINVEDDVVSDYGSMPFDTDNDSLEFEDDEHYELYSDMYEVQADETSYKESCKETFKVKARRDKKKVAKVVESIQHLSKSERKKFINLVKSGKVQADEEPFVVDNIPEIIESDNTLKSCFQDVLKMDPRLHKVFFQILRLSTGIGISTTRAQVVHHLFFSATEIAFDYQSEIKEQIEKLFFQPQAGWETFGSMFHSTLKHWVDNDILKDLKKGIIILLSLAFTQFPEVKQYLPSLSSLLGNVSLIQVPGFDILSYAMNAYLWIADRFKLAMETKSLASFFVGRPHLQSITTRYDSVVHMFPFVMAGNFKLFEESPTAPKNFEDYANMVYKLAHDLDGLYKTCSLMDRNVVRVWKHKISGFVFDIEARFSEQPTRTVPFSVCLSGSSGVGKTVLLPVLAKCAAQANGIQVQKEDFFYRTPSDDFWSGYHGQLVLVEDEKNAMIAATSNVNENKVTLDVVNNAVMRLNMASLEEKGKFTMRSKYYFTTTNKMDWQANANCNEPVAVLRRSIHIVVEVKDHMKRPGTDMLNTELCSLNPLEDDAWLFTALEAVSTPSKDLGKASGWQWRIMSYASGRPVNRVDLHGIMMFLGEKSKAHAHNQATLMANFTDLFAVELCPHGSGARICRECNTDLPVPQYRRECINVGHPIENVCDVKRYQVQSMPMLMVGSACLGGWVYRAFHAAIRTNWYMKMVVSYTRSRIMRAFFSVMALIPRLGERRWDNLLFLTIRSICAYLKDPKMLLVGREVLWEWKPWVFMLFGGMYYAMFPWLASITFGNYWLTSYLVADGVATWINRSSHEFYRTMDIRGAAGTLTDWAAMKARPFLEWKYNYTAITSAVAAALVVYKMVRSKKYVEQGNVQTSEWNKPYQPPEEVSEQRRTTRDCDLVNSLERRVAFIKLYKKGENLCVRCNAVPIKSGVWLIPAHGLNTSSDSHSRGYTHLDLVFNDSPIGANVREVPINYDTVYIFPNKDLALIHIAPTGGHMRDMTPFLTDSHKSCTATYVYRKEDGTLLRENDNTTRMSYGHLGRYKCEVGYSCEAPCVTFVGLCGAVQVSNTKAPSIVSIHVLGVPDARTSACVPIVKSEILVGLQAIFNSPMVLQTGSYYDMDLCDGDDTKVIEDVRNAKSPLNFLESGSFMYFGSVRQRSKPKGTIINTSIAPLVEKIFQQPNVYGNPSFLRSWKPWAKAAAVVTQPHFKDPLDLKRASEDYFDGIKSALASKGFPQREPLDEVTTLSGKDGYDFFKHITITTSSGWPYKVKKSTFITPVFHEEDKVHQWHFEMNDWARGRVEAMRERCKLGLRPNCIYSASVKVEPKRVWDEIDGELSPRVAMPRIFYGASFELIFLMRQYFMPILDIVQECAASEIAVGINATGPGWGKLANHLQSIANNMMPADAEKFDQSITADEQLVIYKNLILVAVMCGYTPEMVAIMECLVTCVIYPIIEFDSDLASFYTLHASGGLGTVQINSIDNAIRHRMFYYSNLFRRKLTNGELALVEENKFSKLMFATFFGDDSLVSVDGKLANKYNLIGYAEYMKTQGVTITTEKKGDVELGTVPLEQCDFLKRSFRHDDDRGVWAAPLNEASILKRLFVVDPSSVLTLNEQCGEAISSSLRDYFQYGKSVFEEKRAKLMQLANEANLINYVPGGFPGYDYYVNEWVSKYGDSSQAGLPPPAAVRG